MANFVSNDNATSLMNAINSKKDTKPVEITYDEWIVLTDEERAGTHYLITDVPAQSGGGHIIENTSGTDMPQEDNLQFVGVYTEDDSTNNRTKVNIVRNMTKAQMDALSSAEKEGFIHITDEPDNPYNGESEGGGHTIVDPSGESMTQQPNMQFVDAHVTNDSTNSSTNIEILSSISESDFDDLDETDTDNEGLYEVESDSDAILTDNMVAHDATHTVREAINELNGKTAKVNRLTYTVTTAALANAIGGNEAQFYISEMTGYSQAIADRTIAHNVVSTFCTGDPRYLAVVSIASNGSVIVNASLPADYEIIIEQIYI